MGRRKTGADQGAPTPAVPTDAPAKPSPKRRSTSWKAGQSGNPKGRPKSGESLAEIVRSEVSPKGLIKRMQFLADNAESEQVRLHALTWLGDRGYGKAPQEITVHRGNPYARKVKDLTEEQLVSLAVLDEPLEDSEPGAPAPTGLN